MAQSTEDYLDSLLRQAMGIPDPEPETKPADVMQDMDRSDVFAMAEGLTGSNSAILGNVYDHNASFTNEGEIEIPAAPVVPAAPVAPEVPAAPVIAPEDMPDPDAPVAISSTPVSGIEFSENLIPDIEEPSAPVITASSEEPAITEEIPVPEMTAIPDAPVIEHDGSLDIIPQPDTDNLVIPTIDEPVIPEPVIEEPVVEEPIIEEPVIEEPFIEEAPVIEEPVINETPVIEEPIIEEPVVEEAPVIEEPVIEEAPVIEEPVIEEAPVIEEPVIEEPIIEEPVIEEPAAEESATPSLSIDDLDPNDSAKALDPDMIAALFASANAEPEAPAEEEVPAEEPAATEEIPTEEVPVEEPAVEEASVEEPVIEEAVIEEEPPVEESMTEEEPAIEEEHVAVEEPVAEEEPAIEEAELEELSIPEEEESPLMPDQEISDLLSSLGEITGENEPEAPSEEGAPAESEAEAETEPDVPEVTEDIAEPEAPAEPEEATDLDLGGIDMFDTDLSAMLENVTNNLEIPEDGVSAEAEGDSDLNDLLGSLDDGSGDLSDIGDLLEKDENTELVDPNTETAEALFASDNDEELFGIDNVIDEEEGTTKGKKKKKKGFSLFGKKKKKSDNVEIIGGDEEMLVDPDLLDIPDESELEKKKGGFFANLFAKLFEEVGEDEEGENELLGIEQTAVEVAQEGADENAAIMAELEGEDAGKGKKDKKEKKKKDKKDKKKKGGEAEGEEGEEGAEPPKKKKKEKKKKEKLPELPSKKLPRKKVVAITLFCITIGIVITFLAFMYPYSQDMKKAKKFYQTGEYQKTYEYMRGHRLTNEDHELYDRTVTLLRIKRPYDSYQNYMKMGLRMEALNALVQGVQMIDKYAEDAATLGVIDKYSQLSRKIYDELYNTFGVTVDRARSWIELEGSPEYTKALYECLLDTSGVKPETNDSAAEATMELQPNDNSVINAEENDL